MFCCSESKANVYSDKSVSERIQELHDLMPELDYFTLYDDDLKEMSNTMPPTAFLPIWLQCTHLILKSSDYGYTDANRCRLHELLQICEDLFQEVLRMTEKYPDQVEKILKSLRHQKLQRIIENGFTQRNATMSGFL